MAKSWEEEMREQQAEAENQEIIARGEKELYNYDALYGENAQLNPTGPAETMGGSYIPGSSEIDPQPQKKADDDSGEYTTPQENTVDTNEAVNSSADTPTQEMDNVIAAQNQGTAQNTPSDQPIKTPVDAQYVDVTDSTLRVHPTVENNIPTDTQSVETPTETSFKSVENNATSRTDIPAAPALNVFGQEGNTLSGNSIQEPLTLDDAVNALNNATAQLDAAEAMASESDAHYTTGSTTMAPEDIQAESVETTVESATMGPDDFKAPEEPATTLRTATLGPDDFSGPEEPEATTLGTGTMGYDDPNVKMEFTPTAPVDTATEPKEDSEKDEKELDGDLGIYKTDEGFLAYRDPDTFWKSEERKKEWDNVKNVFKNVRDLDEMIEKGFFALLALPGNYMIAHDKFLKREEKEKDAFLKEQKAKRDGDVMKAKSISPAQYEKMVDGYVFCRENLLNDLLKDNPSLAKLPRNDLGGIDVGACSPKQYKELYEAVVDQAIRNPELRKGMQDILNREVNDEELMRQAKSIAANLRNINPDDLAKKQAASTQAQQQATQGLTPDKANNGNEQLRETQMKEAVPVHNPVKQQVNQERSPTVAVTEQTTNSGPTQTIPEPQTQTATMESSIPQPDIARTMDMRTPTHPVNQTTDTRVQTIEKPIQEEVYTFSIKGPLRKAEYPQTGTLPMDAQNAIKNMDYLGRQIVNNRNDYRAIQAVRNGSTLRMDIGHQRVPGMSMSSNING